MDKEIKIGKKIYIRNAGKDEYWLQDLIFENPSILGLGDLVPLTKEKKQSSGGRLDILLKDPEDNSMYEVEVMLGDTDPSHIFRIIEYWDLEKRKYPQRQHFPVLIAESFNRRYFNVIQILSINIPMIAIQADLLEIGNQHILNFTKILDIYEEQAEDDNTTNIVNETSWANNANWTLQTAKDLLELLNKNYVDFNLNFTQSYLSLVTNKGNAYWLMKRTNPKSYLGFKERNEENVEAIKNLFDKNSISYTYNKYKGFLVVIDRDFIKTHKDLLLEINKLKYSTLLKNEDE